MSAFSHIPDSFSFEFQGGKFLATKSVWQNTLDKSVVTYDLELEGHGSYGETKIATNTDDWISDSIDAVKKHTAELAMSEFLKTGDISVTESVAEAISSPPEEEPDLELDEAPFPPVPAIEISRPEPGETEESTLLGDAQAVEEVANSELEFHVNGDSPDAEHYGYSHGNINGFLNN